MKFFCARRSLAACRSIRRSARSAAPVLHTERLEDRRLLSVSLAPAVPLPLSTTPTGDPAAPVIADFDGDSTLDVLIAYPSPSAIDPGFIQFGKGDGAGSFAVSAAVNVGVFTGRPVVGDFNGDDLADLAVTNAFDGQVKVLAGNGNGTFDAAVAFDAGISPEPLAVGDFNADGLSDLVAGNRSDNTASVYLGNAGTLLTAGQVLSTATDPASVAIGDFNLDGKPDVLVGASGGVNANSGVLQVYAGNGDGTFNPAALSTNGPRGVTAIANLDGDNGPDVIVGVSDRDRADALLNNGNGTFTLTPGSTGASATKVAVAFDLDSDGAIDLVTAVAGQIDVLPGLGNGEFGNAISFNAAGGSGPAVADLTGDGRAEVLTITATPGQTAGRTLNVSLGQLVGPDLSIAFVDATPAAALTGAKDKLTVRVTNNGNEKLKAETQIQLYSSTDTTVEVTDSLLAQSFKKLNIGVGKSKNVKLKFEHDIAPGSYNLIARVDPFGTTGDLNLFDNTAISASPVNVDQAFVDLSATLPASPAGPLSAGDKVKVQMEVTHLGNVNAAGKVAFSLGLSTDAVADAGDTLLKGVQKGFKIKPGQTKTVNLKFKMPEGVTPGTYTLLGVVDPATAFVDSDISNNTAVGPTQVTVQ